MSFRAGSQLIRQTGLSNETKDEVEISNLITTSTGVLLQLYWHTHSFLTQALCFSFQIYFSRMRSLS